MSYIIYVTDINKNILVETSLDAPSTNDEHQLTEMHLRLSILINILRNHLSCYINGFSKIRPARRTDDSES